MLAERIATLRRARGWSQEELASRASVDRSYLAGIERGLRNPSLRSLIKLANALKVGVAELLQSGQSVDPVRKRPAR